MTEAQLADLLRDCPVLFHMSERGSWPSIGRHGLLSTSALLDLYQVAEPLRTAIESQRRPASVRLSDRCIGEAVIRDQKPMNDAALMRFLQGVSVPDWYRLLNGKVFFWLTRDRLFKLLNARSYRSAEHDVLEIDAAGLVNAHRADITLSPINSGSTLRRAATRGRDTFLRIADCPYNRLRQRGAPRLQVVELAVDYAVPDVVRFVRRVTRIRAGDCESVVYER